MRESIANFVLDYIVIAGAIKHFDESLPDPNPAITSLHQDIVDIGYPKRWDKTQLNYVNATIEGNDCEKCWCCIEVIRNNFFHANKANRPDTQERFEKLINWSNGFLTELLKIDYHIGIRAAEIKEKLKI